MQFSKIALIVGFVGSAIATAEQSAGGSALSQITDGQVQSGGSGSSSSSSSSTSTTSNSGSSVGSSSKPSKNDNSENESELSTLSSYYVSPESNSNAMLMNQIPDGQVQAPAGSSSSSSSPKLAGSENLNTYSYESGAGNPYGNSPGQAQAPGSGSGNQAQGAYSILSSSSTLQQIPDGQAQAPSSSGSAGSYGPLSISSESELPEDLDYSALAEMYGMESYSSPLQQVGDGQVQAPGAGYASGGGQPQDLTDSTLAVGAVPNQYTGMSASGEPEAEVEALLYVGAAGAVGNANGAFAAMLLFSHFVFAAWMF